MHHLAVFGNPIAHSLSPQIHQQFSAQVNILIDYQKILVAPNQFEQAATQFMAAGGAGFNITAPFKTNAFSWVASHSERAKQAQAVNTVLIKEGQVYGDNTDGVGLVRDLQNKKLSLTNRSVVVLGAGGAARGIVPSLVHEPLARLVIINRDIDKARRLFADQAVIAPCQALSHFLTDDVVIIDATSDFDFATGVMDGQSVLKNVVFYDVNYRLHEETAGVAWARSHGFTAYDGLGMLIEQAAESFYQWFNVRPNTKTIRF